MSAAGPLQIDSATYSPFGGARLVVELTGHWLEAPTELDRVEPAQLVLDFDGSARGFAQMPAASFEDLLLDGGYSASFVVPAEAESRLGRAALRLGSGRIAAVPPAMWVAGASPGRFEDEDADLAPHPLIRPPLPKALTEPPEPRAHARSVSEETRLRRTLGDLRRQLEWRARNQERLESTLEQLRTAVETLRDGLQAETQRRSQLESALLSARAARDAARRELAERDAELANALVARDAATAEVAALRQELELAGPGLDASADDDGERGVEEAEALLAETRRLTERLLATTGGAALGADG